MKRCLVVVLLLVLAASFAFGQAVNVVPYRNARATFTDYNGVPLASGCVFFYQGGSSTPQATYTDSTGTVANANPVILDASGSANIWLGPWAYKIVAWSYGGTNCASGAQQWTVDNVPGNLLNNTTISGSTISGSTLTGGTIDNMCVGCTTPAAGYFTTGVVAAASIKALNTGVLLADQYAGADCGAKINAADTALGSSPGEIWATSACGTTIATTVVINSNHTLRMFPGSYTMTAGIAVPSGASNVALLFQPGTQLNSTTNALNFVTVSTANNIVIDGLNVMNSGTSPTGYGIWLNDVNGAKIRNYVAWYVYDGLHLTGGDYAIQMTQFSINAVNGNGIYILNGTGGQALDLFASQGEISVSGHGGNGISWLDGSAVNITDVDISQAHVGIWIAPATGQKAQRGLFTHVVGDSSSSDNWQIGPSGSGVVTGIVATNCVASNSTGGSGINLTGNNSSATIDGFTWDGGQVIYNYIHGVALNGTGSVFRQVRIENSHIGSNSQAGSGLYQGIGANLNVSEFSVVGNTIGYAPGASTNNQGYGVYMGSTNSNYNVSSNDLRNNVTGPIYQGVGQTNFTIRGNLPLAYDSPTNIPVYVAAGTANTTSHIVADQKQLSSGTGTVTFAGGAAFTSASSYFCSATDITSLNPVQMNPASGTSATITGAGNDIIRFVCVGS